ncbi:MAG: anthranilate synthase component I [Candidatus Omnitrophica bacterium]|nr:anthranilate synthase component I [Candidatus Omnitrophota bacterium]
MKNISMDMNPSLEQFKKLAKNNNLIVFSHKFYSDWLAPAAVYCNLRRKIKGESFLLESLEGQEKICRFSFLGFMPICTFKTKGNKAYIKYSGRNQVITSKVSRPLAELRKVMKNFKVAPKENLRFFGGFLGYVGYDTVRFYEPIGKELPDPLGTYDTYFILPKFLIIFDHVKKQIEILSFVRIENSKLKKPCSIADLYKAEENELKSLYRKISSPCKLPELPFSSSRSRKILSSNFKKKDFIAAVKKAKQHIYKGDIIQAVISQRFSTKFKSDPFSAYRYLRILNPSPYMFYLDFKELQVTGSSPEMLLRCEGGELITHPIAGTRPRGKNEQEDSKLKESLLADIKEKAEHIMLVDLARNDLGKVASKGTVGIKSFMEVERFSHVMHIVSEVRAKLSATEDIFSALTSCFPAGTVSGAPKVRAMQIINELEPEKRGIYAGSVGYFSFTKSLDTCIIIRTIVFKGGKAYVQAGAGIVADSRPENEYKETINKAKAQFLALELAAGAEELTNS